MSPPEYSLPAGSWVLVTGANGFIASHIIDRILDHGYKVRGTVRAEKPWLNEFYQSKYGPDSFETAIVPKLEEEGSLDTCMEGMSGVIHVANNNSFNPDPNTVITEVVAMSLNVLKTASRVESVKRVIITSSVVAAYSKAPGEPGDMIIDETTWNDYSVKAAWDPETPDAEKPSIVYNASKVESERAAWKWVAENKPHFVFNSVLPNVNFGTMFFPEKQFSAMGLTRTLLQGSTLAMQIMPSRQWYSNVQDTARVHVIALLDLNVQSERIFACAAPYSWNEVIPILRTRYPDNSLIPDPHSEEGIPNMDIVPAKRSGELLRSFYGRSWMGLEESISMGFD
ncbi:hypothetical protein ASPZODRAFT_65377 [Penicilliopsis zonata CBS 506.65]|uniref:NAD-dependent epimerase/dehydratase domain-containing protein n=1 Tax=Penicilliopsis zonata CBS 506.65 TaxID=1073090 RepID=A0A1L9SJF2_9EURO|nr:hypothetical protein ASPZODRAFT_65377 [Penicilliopsis zonata CBS 506.65]OJJ47350.1 hypothetical protein ASPZODRAFT_65377 [Penicilliopsis zonata CBS 506.65]